MNLYVYNSTMLMMLWRATRRRTKAALRSDKSVLDFALSTMVITTLWVMCDWFELGLDVDDRIDFWLGVLCYGRLRFCTSDG